MKRGHRHSTARTPLQWIVVIIVSVLVLALAFWAVAALYIDLPRRWQLVAASVCTVVMLVGIAILPRWRYKALFLAGCFVVVLAWWLNIAPSDDRSWQTDVARTAWADITDNIVTLHNLRNFDYRTETDYKPNWELRTVDLNKLEAVDLFLTFWGSPWIAHPILSFQFSDGQRIAISVETRKEMQEEYSTVKGFFRQYELIYIIADERDVIRLRTNYRQGEEVYLYRSTASAEEARGVFLNYLQTVNELHQAPAFYNAITSNCTTNIRIHTAAASKGPLPAWDWRLLLNGKSDEFAYQYGRLAGDLPFEALKAQAHINDAARAADQDPDFSVRIRQGRAGF
jgi:hypothetical protein